MGRFHQGFTDEEAAWDLGTWESFKMDRTRRLESDVPTLGIQSPANPAMLDDMMTCSVAKITSKKKDNENTTINFLGISWSHQSSWLTTTNTGKFYGQIIVTC